MNKVLCVKDWKLKQEGAQFVLDSAILARRLKDGELFEMGLKYPYGEYGIGSLMIVEFSSNLIHVKCLKDDLVSQHYQIHEINQLIKSKHARDAGVYGIIVKPAVRRRVRPTSKK